MLVLNERASNTKYQSGRHDALLFVIGFVYILSTLLQLQLQVHLLFNLVFGEHRAAISSTNRGFNQVRGSKFINVHKAHFFCFAALGEDE